MVVSEDDYSEFEDIISQRYPLADMSRNSNGYNNGHIQHMWSEFLKKKRRNEFMDSFDHHFSKIFKS
jgi:hypothetical protein